ncbi:MAG: TadE family protein [Bryobacterales bacterium]|nr:TadE family protein [Bryobacterales bacterium]
MRSPIKTGRSLGSRRGNAMIEFALAAMVLTYSFSAVFQLGYSMYLYNELVGAARAGARYASLAKLSNSGDSSIPSAYSTAIKNMVVYGNTSPAAGDQPVVPGLTTAQVSVGMNFDSGAVPTDCTVSISSYTIDAVFKTFTLTGKPSYKVPYFGQYCSNGPSC